MIKWILISLLGLSTFAQTITAKVNSSQVALEDSFKLTISFESQSNVEPYVSFKLNNGEIISDNTNDASRMMVKGIFAGGKMIQKKIYNYVYEIRARKPGTTVVKDIEVDLGGSIVKHRSLSVRILRQRAALQDYFVRAEVDKSQAYVGERIDLNYYVYFKGEITNPEFVKFPVQKGFLKRFELPRTNVERVSIQGEVYKRLLVYKSVLYPEKTGDLSIDPIELRIQYPDYKSRRRNAFGMSFSFSSATYKTKVIRSDRVKIKSIPIPTENMPKSFTGLVGQHRFELSFNKSKVVVNDVLEARLNVVGDGALEKFEAPRLISSDAFEVFEARAEMIEKTPLDKNKRFDYTYLAKYSEDIPKNSLELSIFNPLTHQFETTKLEIDALSIIGSGTSSSNISSKEATTVAKEAKENIRSTVEKNIQQNVMAPVFKPSQKRNIWTIINYSLGAIAVFILALTAFPYIRLFKRDPLNDLKKNFVYSQIFHYICTYSNNKSGDSLGDKIENSNLSSEARTYFSNLVENASKNEYKGAKLPLKFEKKYWNELIRESNESN